MNRNMPPIIYRKEPLIHTITVEVWTDLQPGDESHLRASLTSYLRGKGIQMEQEFVDGKPKHSVVFRV